ncbi:MAG: GTPase HflX, partial [Dehalococcoidia bacterium]|nr:GTPase HflX [Dehalococcoidia bacterium]
MTKKTINTRERKERAVLVGVEERRLLRMWPIDSSMDELNQLAGTAGADVVGKFIQKMEKPSSTYYLGSGKLQELIDLKSQLEYGTAIFNDELAPRQQRNLEEALGVKVIDRTALILDIFAGHARTSEGKLQVELAQHEYLLPRLAGQWSHLERLGGGIGTRGPGETQIETD